ncbi:MAG: 3-oxoacid CoA-transferase subunit A [Alphaproteobacteria bacterium]|nr:3-oxoacid CoA-transferase subunit A [Alphaproteobacteria bacterium]
MSKAISLTQAAEMIPDGATIMVGGFLAVGSPRRLLQELARQGRKHLTLITNDTSKPGVMGNALLIENKCVDHLIASHIGTNPETQRQMIAGELKVELCPQGSLVERIRAGGAGLGGVLTPTGVGTVAAEGKREMEIDGKKFLLESPLKADFALIGARRSDYRGNLDYALTARNFNPLMALAGATVIAEPNEIVPIGVIPPDEVVTPHVLVDYIIERRQSNGR